jgi:hypothetical protein
MAFNNGNYYVFWKYDSSTSEIFCKLVVKATGWVGLGFSNTNTAMSDMDVVIAGVSGGQGFIGVRKYTKQSAFLLKVHSSTFM